VESCSLPNGRASDVPLSVYITRCNQLGDERFEKVLGNGARSGELHFQLCHQGHQLIHLRHDPALFGEGHVFRPKGPTSLSPGQRPGCSTAPFR